MNVYFKDKEPKELRGRILYSLILVVAAFFVIFVRLWYLQVKESGYYGEMAENNRLRTVKSPAPRGLIHDRTGVKLADNRPGFDLYIVPEDVTDWARTKELLKEFVDIDSELVDEKIRKSKGRPPFRAVKLKEDLSWEETVKIESFKFEMPGTLLDVTPKRNYIYGPEFAHLIGYLGEINDRELKSERYKDYSQGDLIGKRGAEKKYDEFLRGSDGTKELEVDARGRKIKVVNWVPPYPGNNLTLTIDIGTQLTAYEELKDVVGAAIAIEPSTGKVLAMVSTPAFDPNSLTSGISSKQWRELVNNPLKLLTNRAIQGQYPPASTFKPIHAAAALEEQVITPKTKIFSGPSFWFGRRQYRDWKASGHGTIDLYRAIVGSSDTFFYQVGLKIGVDRLAHYSRGFGFGSLTGIPLQDEKYGLVPTSEWKKKTLGKRWYNGETISVGVGQGYMLSTPLQLLNAYAAIANGGTLYTPYLVSEIRTPTGELVKSFSPVKNRAVLVSSSTLDYVKNALKGVVDDEEGTAHFLKRSGLKIAGKTGTAQVTKLTTRYKAKDIDKIKYGLRDHAWFVGYAPYDDPKIAVVVLVEHGGFGATAAAPVARKMIDAYLNGVKNPGWLKGTKRNEAPADIRRTNAGPEKRPRKTGPTETSG